MNFLPPAVRTLLLLVLLSAAPTATRAQPGPQDTLFLTWLDDPTTTMTAQWLADGVLPPTLEGSSANADFGLPRLLDPITIDGHGDDWSVHGLRLDYLAQPDGQWPDPTGMQAAAKLGWTPQGLAVLVHVTDDEATQADDGKLWEADSIELFLGTSLQDRHQTQFIICPAMGSKYPTLRTSTHPKGDATKDLPLQVASQFHDNGYTLEALLPWANLGIDAQIGTTVTVQLIINDRDGPFAKEQLAWYPANNTSANRRSMHTLRLTESPDTTVRAMAQVRHDAESGQVTIDLGGEPRLIGETVTLRSGDRTLGRATFENVLGFAGQVFELPVDPATGRAPRIDALSLHLDDRVIARTRVPQGTWNLPPQPVTARWQSDDKPKAQSVTSTLTPFDNTGWFIHRLSLTDLAPGSDHLLEVPGHDEPILFRTAPATLDQPLCFAQGGDVGISVEVGMLHQQAAKWEPLFGLVGGDCAYANGVQHERWHDYLKLWHDHMITPSGYSIPMLSAIGNHEVQGGWGKAKAQAPFFYALFGPLYKNRGAYQTLDFGDYMSLFILDSGHTARHHGQQVKWLSTALAGRTQVPHRFGIYHVPAYPSHRPYEGQQSALARTHWVPLFEQFKLSAVFENHDHTYKRTHLLKNSQPHPDGVLYLGDGCWGRTPRTVTPDLPYLAVAKSSRNVIRATIYPDGTQSYLAVDEYGKEIDRFPLRGLTDGASR